jgi:hypothetical protein
VCLASGGNRTKIFPVGPPARLENGEFATGAAARSVKEPAIALDRRLDVSFALFRGRRRSGIRLRDT